MKNIMKGRRSRFSKCLAVFMALVMVLSVIYVTDRTYSAKASDDTTASCTFPTIDLSELTVEAGMDPVNISIQFGGETNVTFGAVSLPEGYELETSSLLKILEGTTTKLVDGFSQTWPIKAKKTDGSGEAAIEVGRLTISVGDIGLSCSGAYKAEQKNLEITASPSSDSVTQDDIKVTDENSTVNYIYGSMKYGSSTDGTTPTSWSDTNSFAISQDGSYTPYVAYYIGETQVSTAAGAVVDIDVTAPTVSVALAAIGTVNGTISGSSVTNAYVSDGYKLTVTTNEWAWKIELAKKSGSDGQASSVRFSTMNVETENGYTHTAILQGSAGDAGKTVTYTLQVEDEAGNAAEEQSLTIAYVDGAISITGVQVNNTEVSVDANTAAGTINTKSSENKNTLSFGVSSAVTVSEVTVTGDADNADEIVVSGDAQNGYTAELPVTEDGSKTYTISAKNAYNQTATTDITVVTDNTAPAIDAPSLKEGEKAVTGNISTNKLADYKVVLSLEDAYSEVSSVIVSASYEKDGKTYNSTPKTVAIADDKKGLEVENLELDLTDFQDGDGFSADALKGQTVTYSILAVDELGNQTAQADAVTFTKTYDLDAIAVTYDKTEFFKPDAIDATLNVATNVAYTASGKSGTLTNATSYTMSYTITSDLELTEDDIQVFVNGVAATGTKSLTGGKSKSEDTGCYSYGFTFTSSASSTSALEYTVTVTNANDVSAATEANVLFVDVNAPNVSEKPSADAEKTDQVTWYKNLTVAFTVADSKESFQSGIESVKVTQGETETTLPGEAGVYNYTVPESTSTAGTTFTLTVTDKAGNVKEAEKTYYVDNTVPTTTLTLTDDNGKAIADQSYVAGDVSIAAAVVENIALDGKLSISQSGNDTADETALTMTAASAEKKLSTVFAGAAAGKAADGVYTVSLAAADKVNTAETKTLSFTVDNTAPVNSLSITSTLATGATEGFYSGDVTLAYSATDTNLDSYALTDNGTAVTGTDGVLTISGAGAHEVVLNSVDKAGNAGNEVKVSFTIDAAPVIDVKINDTAYTEAVKTNNEDGAKVEVTLTEANPVSFTYKETVKKPGEAEAVTNGEVALTDGKSTTTYTADGEYTIAYTAKDKAASTATKEISFLLDRTAPAAGSVKLDSKAPTADQMLSTTANADSSVSFTVEDALSDLDGVTIYAKAGDKTSEAYALTVNSGVKTQSFEVKLSDFQKNLTEDDLKGKTVTYYAKTTDALGNSQEAELFTAEYYLDNVTVEAVDIEVEAGASINKEYQKDDATNSLTNAKTYKVTFKITSEAKQKITASQIVLSSPDGAYSATAQIVTSEETAEGNTYTGYFEPTEDFGNVESITYTVTATNGNNVSNSQSASLLFVDILNPTVSQTESADAQNSDWYRNLKIIYTAEDPAATTGKSYVSGVSKVEISQNGGDYTEITQEDGSYPQVIEESTDVNGTTVRVRVTDQAGNVTYYPEDAAAVYYVDNTVPQSTLSVTYDGNTVANDDVIHDTPVITYGMTDNIYVDGSLTITYNGTELGTPVTVSGATDNKSLKDATETKDLETLLSAIGAEMLDGTYTITVKTADKIGSIDEKTISFTLDNTPPVITEINMNGTTYTTDNISQCFADVKAYSNLSFTVTAKDATDEVEKIVVKQTAGTETTEQTFTADTTDKLTLLQSKSNEGTKVEITVSDKYNSRTYTYYFLADNTAPQVSLNVVDDGFTGNGSVLNDDPVIRTADSDNILVASRKLTIKTPNFTMEYTGTNYLGDKKLSQLIGTAPADGDYTITITAVDRAGQSDTKTVSFRMDNTKPENSMKVTTAAPAKISQYSNTAYDGAVYGQYYNTNVTLSYEAADTNIGTVTVTDNGSVIASSASGSVTISAEGEHTIVLNSVDKAGNKGTARSFSFTIDKTAPVITTSLNGTAYVNNSGEKYLKTDGSITVSVSDTNKDDLDLTRVEKITEPSQAAKTQSAKIGEGTTTYSTEADYEISYVAVDRAGNTSETRVVQFRVDKTAPELSISGIAEGGTATSSVTVTYGMKEAFYWDMTSAKINIYKGIDGQAEQLLKTVDFNAKNANDTLSETFSEDGDYRFEFIAEDKTGNTADKSYSFILDGTAPVIELSGVKNYDKTDGEVNLGITITEAFYTSNKLVITGTRTDIDGKKEDLNLGGYPINNFRVSNITESFTEDGIYDIEVTSTDKAGNSTTEKVHFTIDTKEPVIGDLSKYDGTVLNAFDWSYTNDELVTDLTVCDVVVYLDGVEYDGLNDVSDGKHILRVVATDEIGHTVEKQVEFLLDTIAPNLIVTGVEDGDRLLESTEISVSLQIDGDILDSVTLNGVEQALDGNTCTFTVDTAGDYELVIKAHDEAGNTVEKVIHFEYGKKFNWLWIILLLLLLVIVVVVIILVRKKQNKDKK